MDQQTNPQKNQQIAKDCSSVEDPYKILESLDRVRYQVEKILRDVNKLRQERRELQQQIEEIETKLENEIKRSESMEKTIHDLQIKNDLLTKNINRRSEQILWKRIDGLLGILPELSCLAGKEPQSIQGLTIEHVLSRYIAEIERFFGKVERYPNESEIIEKDGTYWIEVEVNQENREKLNLTYDWGKEKPLEGVEFGQKVRLRLLRYGWKTSNAILVPAVVTGYSHENIPS